jgi:RNase H-like domain found in reverse transcriptase/Integrase zinc binding domain/Integrase core domain
MKIFGRFPGVCVDIFPVGDYTRHRIICFASKSLTSTERNYAQTQREALAVVWAVEHFHFYLLGAKFTVKTDAMGVKFIFDKAPDAPKRLLRRAEGWAMRLDLFDYEIVHVKGELNIADSSSRLFEDTKAPEPYYECQSPCEIARIKINEVFDVPFDEGHLPIAEVKREMERCDEMTKLVAAIRSNKWEGVERGYELARNELEILDGVVLKDGLVLIPPKLRAKALKIAHIGHLGIVRTKSVVNERIWWPKIGLAVEEWIKACRTCILNGRKHSPAPMQRTILPEAQWEYVAIDYCGPFASQGGIHVVALVDYFSRYVVTSVVKSTAWADLHVALDEIFYRLGYPARIKSDNGPPFFGGEYKKYCNDRGIETVFSWPLSPQQNGSAESTMKHVNRGIQNATAENVSIQSALRDRIRAHNDARHTETRQIPSEVMFGRRLARGLPSARPSKVTIDEEEMRRRDWDAKMKGKETQDKRRRARSPSLEPGDKVVLQRAAKKKGQTPYDPTELTVQSCHGNDVVLEGADGVPIRRDVTKVRKLPTNASEIEGTSTTIKKHRVEPDEKGEGVEAGSRDERPKRDRKKTDRLGDFGINAMEVDDFDLD